MFCQKRTTTCAIVYLLLSIYCLSKAYQMTKLLECNTYVRCLIITFSINQSINKKQENCNFDYLFSIVDSFCFSKYRVGVDFNFLNTAMSMSISINRPSSLQVIPYNLIIIICCTMGYIIALTLKSLTRGPN